MSDDNAVANALALQWRQWTLVGPIPQPPSVDEWLPIALDGAQEVPTSYRANGQDISIRRVTTDSETIDFRAQFGIPAGRPQVSAFCEFEVPEDGTLSFSYGADYFAAVWLDGREVYSTRSGCGDRDLRVTAGLTAGRHVLNVRIITGSRGWSLVTRVLEWQSGFSDEVRTDRKAKWRDYTQSPVRLELRTVPDGQCGPVSKEANEALAMNMGVNARWLSAFYDLQGAYFPSEHFPMWEGTQPEHETQLRDWVETVHRHRMAAMCWHPLVICTEGWDAHEDWRQEYLVPPNPNAHDRKACCINSPYGDALIAFTIETLQKFNFDGFWYDGSFLTPGWNRPQPISCVCSYCRAKFLRDTGLETPTDFDWTQPSFAHWVQWRYEMFAAYWQRLVDEVHAIVPEAAILFNTYHREGSSWIGAIPWQTFGHDFPAATEADGEPLKGLYYTRLLRAYGRESTEVWMGMSGASQTVRGEEFNARAVTDFAVAACTGGGFCSLGADDGILVARGLRAAAEQITPRVPYLNLPSVPYAALHLSQQTETFVFGRNPLFPGDDWVDHYGHSVAGWHHALAFAGLTCDVLFDDHLRLDALIPYPILVLPLASALTPAQYQSVLAYAEQGGVVITGPWLGVCDRWGEPNGDTPVVDRTLFPFGDALPDWEMINNRPEIAIRVGEMDTLLARPLHRQPLPNRENSVSLEWTDDNPIFHTRAYGRGRILQMALDLGTLFRDTNAAAVANAVGRLLRGAALPALEVTGGDGLLLGIFHRGDTERIVHVQQFAPLWDTDLTRTEQPPTRWGAVLTGRGSVPHSVRCAVPEMGPPLPITTTELGWQVDLPPFVWGHVVIIEEKI